jgi:probable addiction module antidote protein
MHIVPTCEQVMAHMIAHQHPIRERFWLDRIEQYRDRETLFVCGDIHLATFPRLLEKELIEDRGYAVALLQLSMESLDNPEERGGALLSIRAIAEAYGGLGAVAAQAGVSRESLYRSLSAKGNPTLKTLVAVLKTLGLRLSVAEKQQAETKKEQQTDDFVAA